MTSCLLSVLTVVHLAVLFTISLASLRFNTILASRSFTQLRAVFEEYSKVNYNVTCVFVCVHASVSTEYVYWGNKCSAFLVLLSSFGAADY